MPYLHHNLRLMLVSALLTLALLSGCADQESTPDATPAPVPSPETQPGPTDPRPQPAPGLEQPFPGLSLTWSETTRSPIALYESQDLATGGRLFILGGYYNQQIQATKRAFTFDPATGKWAKISPLPEALTHAGQALYQGKIYLAGGFIGAHPGPPTDHVWVYDIATDTWSAGPALPAKLGAGALVELGGCLHFFGGTFRKGERYIEDSAKHWVLDLTSAAPFWTEAAPLPNPRNHLSGAAVGGEIYAVGGQELGDEDYGNTRTVEAYDPQSDSWREVASLPEPLGHISAGTFAYRGRVVVVMGVTQGREKLSDVLAYDPTRNVWEELTSMPGGRSATVAGIIDDKIVLGTGNVAGRPLDTTWIGSWDENGQ